MHKPKLTFKNHVMFKSYCTLLSFRIFFSETFQSLKIKQHDGSTFVFFVVTLVTP